MNIRTIAISALLLMMAVGSLSAQKKKDNTTTTTPPVPAATQAKLADDPLEGYKKMFGQALRYSDLSTCAIALNYIVANSNDAAYKDTLAIVYSELGANVQALSVSKEILNNNPNNLLVLDVAAKAEESLNLIKEALEDYEKLYKATNKTFYLYKVSVMQYYLKRFGECDASITAILNTKDATTEKINVNVDRQSQAVPLNAIAFNMRGMLNLEVNNFKGARDNFNEAIRISPDFVLAKNNLALTDKLEAEKNAPATPAKDNKGTSSPKGGK